MSSSATSDISIDITANTKTSHPIFFKQVIMAAATLGDMVMLPMFTAAAFFKQVIIFLLGATVTLGDMVMLLVFTVAAFLKEIFYRLLAAAEQLNDGVNHARVVFIIGSLIGFAEVKAQAVTGFPFNTHEMLMKCSITSLLFFGIACVTQVFAPPAYKRILCLAEIACLICSIVSLASAFYF